MQTIPILGGYAWIKQEEYNGVPTLLHWGAKRKLPYYALPKNFISSEKQYQIFATKNGYIGGYGYFAIWADGIYEFQGVGKPELHESM